MNLRKTKLKGRCPVARCTRPPRNLADHPGSCQFCGTHYKALWRLRNPEKAAFDNLRASARKRKKGFSISFEDFMAVIAPTRYMDEKGRTRHCLHIDRANPELGYIRGNIRVVTCEENVIAEHERRRQAFVDAKVRGREGDI